MPPFFGILFSGVRMMSEQVLTPKIALMMIGLLVFLVWYLAGRASPGDTAAQEKSLMSEPLPAANSLQVSALATNATSEKKSTDQKMPTPVRDGIYVSADKTRVSIHVQQMQRLLLVQRLAEALEFAFSLPDQGADYWSQSIAVNMDEAPVLHALSSVIGTKQFTVEMAYESAADTHRISAIFLSTNNSPAQLATPPAHKPALSPIHERGAAPASNVIASDEQQIKRDIFFTADDQTRMAILQEMSPVGHDLHYILISLKRDKNAQVRALAAQRLSFSDNYMATQGLLDALADTDPGVVQMAVESLVSLGDSSVIGAIEEKLNRSENGKAIAQDAARRIQSRFTLAADSPE